MHSRTTVFRWDLDKTYLVSHFESLRKLVRVPFESAADKVAVPGVAEVIKGLRRCSAKRGSNTLVYFLSASPPQIGGAIRAKLELDGIEYDGITFKNQMDHLIHGRFDALREQVGYKLTMLLRAALELEADCVEYLFGDDWESDPLVYSLYADIVAGRLALHDIDDVLERAQVHKHYLTPINDLIEELRGRRRNHLVGGVFILRQRRAASAALDAFGPRLAWFDNYFECSLKLYSMGLLGPDSVVEVAGGVALSPEDIASSYHAAAARDGIYHSRLGPVRRRLMAAGLSEPLRRPNPAGAAAGAWRRLLGLAAVALGGTTAAAVPDYLVLAEGWTHRGRKERESHE